MADKERLYDLNGERQHGNSVIASRHVMPSLGLSPWVGSGGRHSPVFEEPGVGEEGTVIMAKGQWHGGGQC